MKAATILTGILDAAIQQAGPGPEVKARIVPADGGFRLETCQISVHGEWKWYKEAWHSKRAEVVKMATRRDIKVS